MTPYRGRFAVVASVILESATFSADGHSVKELGQFWNPSRLVGLWIGMGAAWLVVNLAASDALAALHELAPRWAILAASTALFLGTAVVATIARIRLACDDRPNERIPSMAEHLIRSNTSISLPAAGSQQTARPMAGDRLANSRPSSRRTTPKQVD